MNDELQELKSTLRSLVVSSPTQVDVRTLLRDYRSMVGTQIPVTKYGYKDPLEFLRKECSDSFTFSGLPSNPVVTLIVPDKLKHIDKFVQKQKVSPGAKFLGKRRSVPQSAVRAATTPAKSGAEPERRNNIYESFVKKAQQPAASDTKTCDEKPPDIEHQNKENEHGAVQRTEDQCRDAFINFAKRRMPLFSSSQYLDDKAAVRPPSAGAASKDTNSERHASGSNGKQLHLEQLKGEIMQIVSEATGLIWCTDLLRLYRERYGRELKFSRLGYTSIISLVFALELEALVWRPDDTGDWAVMPRSAASAAPHAAPRRHYTRAPAHADPSPTEDALPGIDFEPDVFPIDCMHYLESIPAISLDDFKSGAMVEVMIGEVYSPSHFWLLRLGDQYHIAMEDMMDDMTQYYTRGEGATRRLARGATRVGHYCSSAFEGDWHRSLIVQLVDCDTVKVRHVDYGTVDTVSNSELKPLRREWAKLPAQAVRARLAGVRPAAGGRRWPHCSAAHFLDLVRNKQLVANVVSCDPEEGVVETLLLDTSGANDVCISAEMVRGGHADARADSALLTAETYLYPRFEAIENGDTPNFADIGEYLRYGIRLEHVDAYRRHVPPSLLRPAAPPVAAVAAQPHPPRDLSPSDARDSSSRGPCEPVASGAPQTLCDASDLLLCREDDSLHGPARESSAHDTRSPSPNGARASSRDMRNVSPTIVRNISPSAACNISPSAACNISPSAACNISPSAACNISPSVACNLLPNAASNVPPGGAHTAPAGDPPPGAVYVGAPRPPLVSAAPGQCWQAPPPSPLVQRAFPPPYGPGYGYSGSPPPPYAGPAPGTVTLSVAECEAYRVLSALDPPAAHWYMGAALSRALTRYGVAPRHVPLDPAATEFRMLRPYPPGYPHPHIQPPPGF